MFWKLWARRDEPDLWVCQDPYTAGLIRVAEALRRTPDARDLTARLSFPDVNGDPEGAYLLKRCVQGMADAGQMFRLSFESAEVVAGPPNVHVAARGSVDITVAMRPGQVLAVIGRMTADVSGSVLIGDEPSLPPPIDLIAEGRAQEVARQAEQCVGLGRGGLLITLARCCTGLGARMVLPDSWQALPPAAALFGEAQSRFLAAVRPADIPGLGAAAGALDVPFEPIGTVGGNRLTVDGFIDIDLQELTGWQS